MPDPRYEQLVGSGNKMLSSLRVLRKMIAAAVDSLPAVLIGSSSPASMPPSARRGEWWTLSSPETAVDCRQSQAEPIPNHDRRHRNLRNRSLSLVCTCRVWKNPESAADSWTVFHPISAARHLLPDRDSYR